MPDFDLSQAARPGLLRRLAALFYDAWLIAALWLLGATADAFIRSAMGLAPGQGNHLLLQTYLELAPMAFYVGFWTHGGQTLGMRAWRIRVVNSQGQIISLRQAVIRYLAALLSFLPLGLGLLWVVFDPERAAWHDRLSGTWLVMTEKR
jgi:uncharacterized RDD family membrane protein YckC